MKIINLKIAVLLKTGFTFSALLVIILGITALLESNRISEQTAYLYKHPLHVRKAIANIKTDILQTSLSLRDLSIGQDTNARVDNFNAVVYAMNDVPKQIEIFYERYLGPSQHTEDVNQAFIKWKAAIDAYILLYEVERLQKISNIPKFNFEHINVLKADLLAKINIIDKFSWQKADDFYSESIKINEKLNFGLIYAVVIILLLFLIVNYFILRIIRIPLRKITDAATRNQAGELSARADYVSKNELGQLSMAFNNMAEANQLHFDLKEKEAALAEVMLREEDAELFFKNTIAALVQHTGASLGAVYLLDAKKTEFRHFTSYGTDSNIKQTFNASTLEGEFGSVLYTRKIEFISNIPEDTPFVFYTVSGKFVPREIVTIPIISKGEVTVIISLASMHAFNSPSQRLIKNIHSVLNSRVEGILANQKMKELMHKLEFQNSELELQKAAISSQSAELMQQNTELEMQKRQLGEANRLKSSFLSTMSHELRTPLNSIIGLSGLLHRTLENQIPPREYGYIEVVERNGKHLLTLINDILDLSQIEAGKETVNLSTFNINEVVSSVIQMISPQAIQKNINLIHNEADTVILVNSDIHKFRQIAINLIGNAIKFTEKGKVEVMVWKTSENFMLTVSDTGIGISEKHILHIFDEFRQGDASPSRRHEGTGLGLAIAQKYAWLMGGEITVKSSFGKGSVFTLSLPITVNAKGETIPNTHFNTEKKVAIQTAFKHELIPASKTILIVEDSEPAIIQIQNILEENGYNTLVSRNGADALQMLNEIAVDAIILDLMMPEIDGFQTLKMIREQERTAHIPVLILTAKHITKDELQFLKSNNIHQLLQKGDLNGSELIQSVAKMVNSQTTKSAYHSLKPQSIEGKPLVLIVEDNPDNMLSIKGLLGDRFKIMEAIDGKEALIKAQKLKPHLILMDIALPEMDGFVAFHEIRKIPLLQHIPIVAVTATALHDERAKILAMGFDAFIPKPIDEKLLEQTIAHLLYGTL